jgi:hypothetical protein
VRAVTDPRTPVDELRAIAAELDGIKRRIDGLESPSGTQAFRTVAKLSALVDNIQEQLDEYNASRWTNVQITAEINSRVNAAIAAAFAGNVSITGSLTVNGALAAASLSTGGGLSVGGAATVNGVVTVPGARSLDLSSASSRVTAWIAGDGRLGHT